MAGKPAFWRKPEPESGLVASLGLEAAAAIVVYGLTR